MKFVVSAFVILVVILATLVGCGFGNQSEIISLPHEVRWMDSVDISVKHKNIISEDMGEVYFEESVLPGQKANWPNTSGYTEPTKAGYVFAGWDFDWENTPITRNTDIHAKWIEDERRPTYCVPPVDNCGSDAPIDGDGDAGLPASGSEWDRSAIDSVRSNFDDIVATPMDDWITVVRESSATPFTGAFRYYVAENTGPYRVGRVKITTPGDEIADPAIWGYDGADGVKTFCSEAYVYIHQRGAEEETDTCTGETKGNGAYVSATIDGVEYEVGTYTKSSECTSNWIVQGLVDSTKADFLKDFRFSGGKIYAKVKLENENDSTRSTQYKTLLGDFEDYFTVYQQASGGGGGDDPDTDFRELITLFSPYVTIPENGVTWSYLYSLFFEAKSQFFDNTSINGLPYFYSESNFPNIYNFYGGTVDRSNAYDTMTAWLFAEQLSEVYPTKRNNFYKVAYNYAGHTKDASIYGYEFHSDPNVARLVASAVYSTMRGIKNPDIAAMRGEIGGSKYSRTVSYYSDDETRTNVGDNDFYVDLRKFMPTAPGPYLSSYADRSSIGGVPFPNDNKESDYNLSTDLAIYNYVIQNYNLDSSTNLQRTVQAIADKEACVNHLFGTSKTIGSYTFSPVFGASVLGTTIDPDGLTKFSDLIYDAGIIGSRARGILQSGSYYGRRRPGQGVNDGSRKSSSDDRLNILCDFDIENNDGCPEGYYNQNGDWVTDNGWTENNFCENSKNNIYANSYPSGHSSYIWSIAMTLMEIFPNKANLIMQAANKFAVNRTIARYHWNSDTINGRVLGSAINPVMHAASDFDTRLEDAKDDVN